VTAARKIPFRKEVNAVKYAKPEVAFARHAVEAIQSHIAKGQFQPPDNMHLTTNTAYEADE
jgi:hypothetical protein